MRRYNVVERMVLSWASWAIPVPAVPSLEPEDEPLWIGPKTPSRPSGAVPLLEDVSLLSESAVDGIPGSLSMPGPHEEVFEAWMEKKTSGKVRKPVLIPPTSVKPPKDPFSSITSMASVASIRRESVVGDDASVKTVFAQYPPRVLAVGFFWAALFLAGAAGLVLGTGPPPPIAAIVGSVALLACAAISWGNAFAVTCWAVTHTHLLQVTAGGCTVGTARVVAVPLKSISHISVIQDHKDGSGTIHVWSEYKERTWPFCGSAPVWLMRMANLPEVDSVAELLETAAIEAPSRRSSSRSSSRRSNRAASVV